MTKQPINLKDNNKTIQDTLIEIVVKTTDEYYNPQTSTATLKSDQILFYELLTTINSFTFSSEHNKNTEEQDILIKQLDQQIPDILLSNNLKDEQAKLYFLDATINISHTPKTNTNNTNAQIQSKFTPGNYKSVVWVWLNTLIPDVEYKKFSNKTPNTFKDEICNSVNNSLTMLSQESSHIILNATKYSFLTQEIISLYDILTLFWDFFNKNNADFRGAAINKLKYDKTLIKQIKNLTTNLLPALNHRLTKNTKLRHKLIKLSKKHTIELNDEINDYNDVYESVYLCEYCVTKSHNRHQQIINSQLYELNQTTHEAECNNHPLSAGREQSKHELNLFLNATDSLTEFYKCKYSYDFTTFIFEKNLFPCILMYLYSCLNIQNLEQLHEDGNVKNITCDLYNGIFRLKATIFFCLKTMAIIFTKRKRTSQYNLANIHYSQFLLHLLTLQFTKFTSLIFLNRHISCYKSTLYLQPNFKLSYPYKYIYSLGCDIIKHANDTMQIIKRPSKLSQTVTIFIEPIIYLLIIAVFILIPILALSNAPSNLNCKYIGVQASNSLALEAYIKKIMIKKLFSQHIKNIFKTYLNHSS